MTNTKTTKRALLSSVMALFLCFAMLLGTTYAWFTDSVTSANNVIKSGNLDIELDYWDGDSWETVEGTNSLFTNNLWEPGHTEVVYLKLSNLGSLALKYQLSIDVLNETEGTNKLGETFKLSEYIQMGVVDGKNGETNAYTKDAAGRAQAIAEAGKTGIIGNGYAKQGNMEQGAEDLYMAVVVYMPEDVGNDANAMTGTAVPTIELGVKVLATQYTSEEDGFDNTYDENAWAEGMLVYSEADLKAAIANGGNVKLGANVELKETVEIAEGATVTLDLNGKTIASSVTAIKNNGTLTISGDGVIDVSSATQNTLQVIDNHGVLTLNGGTYKGARTMYSYALRNYGTMSVNQATVDGGFGGVAIQSGASAVITDGTFSNSMNEGAHVLLAYANTNVTVNGGNFLGHQQDTGTFQYTVIGTDGANIAINGGNFVAQTQANGNKLMLYGNITVSGGTFDVDPGNYVAEGYKAVQSGDLYHVVPEDVDAVVTTAAELKEALANGGNIVLANDIDMSDWTSIDASYKAFAIDGNGNSILNLSAPLYSAMGPTTSSVKDLTFENAKISVSGDTGSAGVVVGYMNNNGGGKLTIDNCHVVDSEINAFKWAGAFVGANASDAGGVEITNCTVKNTAISTTDSSCGAIIGHTYAQTVIKDCQILGTTSISCAEERNGEAAKAGYVVGTVNAGTTTITNVSVDSTVSLTNVNSAEPLNNGYVGRNYATVTVE